MKLLKILHKIYHKSGALILIPALILVVVIFFSRSPQTVSQVEIGTAERVDLNLALVQIASDDLVVQAGSCDAAHSGLDSSEKTLIDLINNYRQQNGLNSLTVSGQLNTMASNLSEDMNANKRLGHVDSQGRNLAARFSACVTGLRGLGYENAGLAPTPESVFNGWRQSPPHDDNMLSDSVAIGVARAGNYWTAVFTTQNPGGPVTDDNSTSPTNTPTPTRTPTPTVTPTSVPNATNPTPTPTTPPTGASPTPTPRIVDVSIENDGFHFSLIDVPIGSTVRWTNNSNSNVSINSDPHPLHTDYPPLNLGIISPGASVQLKFEALGKYRYHNHLNPSQKGWVQVFDQNPVGLLLEISLPGIGIDSNRGENSFPVKEYINVQTQVYEIDGKLVSTRFGEVPRSISPSKVSYRGSTRIGSLDQIDLKKHYTIKVRTNNSLRKKILFLELENKITLVTGDINQDNVLDLSDYNLIISCFETKPCSQKENSDFNLDGKVDERDLNIFYTGLANRQGD